MQSAFPCTIAVCRGVILPLFVYSTAIVGLTSWHSSRNFTTCDLPCLAAKCSIVTGLLSKGYNSFIPATTPLGALLHLPSRHSLNVVKSWSRIALCNTSFSLILSPLMSCALNCTPSTSHSHSMIIYFSGSLAGIETLASSDGVSPALLYLSQGSHNISNDIDSIIAFIACTLPHLAATCRARSPPTSFSSSCLRMWEAFLLSLKSHRLFCLSAKALKSSYIVSSICSSLQAAAKCTARSTCWSGNTFDWINSSIQNIWPCFIAIWNGVSFLPSHSTSSVQSIPCWLKR